MAKCNVRSPRNSVECLILVSYNSSEVWDVYSFRGENGMIVGSTITVKYDSSFVTLN